MSPRARARNMNVLDSLLTPYSAVLPPGRISHNCLGLTPVFMNADLNTQCSGICGKGPEFAACSPLLLVSPPHAEHIRGFSDPVTGPGEADNSSSFCQFATRCQIPWLISLAQDTTSSQESSSMYQSVPIRVFFRCSIHRLRKTVSSTSASIQAFF
jgi:hypothetical protein